MRYLKLFEKFNQSEIDKALDKINKHGVNSLTWHEKEILDNPESQNELEGTDLVHESVSRLLKFGLISNDNINIYKDYFEIYSIKGKQFPYFIENFLKIEPNQEDDGVISLNISGEDYGEEEDEKEKNDVYHWINQKWGEIEKLKMFFNFSDSDDEDLI
jgi:hypothetical protein